MREHKVSQDLPALWVALVFLMTFTVYSLTLDPSLFRNDSPETITACVTLGVSHPPGYPLHTLLGRLFSLLLLGNPSMTLNYFSALLGAMGVCLFMANLWTFLRWAAPPTEARTSPFGVLALCFACSFALAFSKSYWSLSLAAKGGIYILQVVLELSFFLFLQTWLRDIKSLSNSKRPGKVLFLAFLFTLGCANHWPTQALLLPALLLGAGLLVPFFRLGVFAKIPAPRVLLGVTLSLLVLSLYLYLPLRSHLYPHLNFGAPFTFQRFCTNLLRLGYFRVETMASFFPTAGITLKSKSFYISARYWSEFGVLFAFLSLGGIWILWRKGQKTSLLFLLTLLATVIGVNLVYLQVQPIEYWHMDDHLLTANWITALFGSIGLLWSLERSKWTGAALLVLVPLLTLRGNLALNDQSREFLYRGYGMGILRSMDRNGFYFAESDYDYFALLYLTEVEHRRPDVGLTLTTFWDKDYWKDLMEHQYGDRFSKPHPIYCCFPNGDFMGQSQKRGWPVPFEPTGTIIAVRTSNDHRRGNPALRPLDDLWERYLEPGIRSQDPIDQLLLKLCSYPYLNMALYLDLRDENKDRVTSLNQRGFSLDPSKALWDRLVRMQGAELGPKALGPK